MSKHSKMPFDSVGGVVRMQRRLLTSERFIKLSAQAKALLFLLQRHWTPNGPVGFGVRQAEAEIPCSRATAMKVFKELQEAGFIVLIDDSVFCSRTSSRTRTWRLTWMPCWRNRAPTNDWEKSQ